MTPSDPTPNTSADPTPATPDTPPPLPETAGPDVAVQPASGDPAAAVPSDTPPPLPEQQAASPRAPALPAQPVPAVPPAPQPHDLSRIAQDLQIRKAQVEAVVQLLDEENTVPFITRYRKERTGGLNEEVIRRIQDRIAHLRTLTDRKQTILKSIAYQGRLTDDLVQAILAAESPKRLEDLYLPYKPKKKSKATEAREKGLEPFALAVWSRDPVVGNVVETARGMVDPDKWLLNEDDVLAGVRDILADVVADTADVRGPMRNYFWDVGTIVAVRNPELPEGKGKEYDPYTNFKELAREIPPHRVLAINRGEKGNVLKVRVEVDRDLAQEIAEFHVNLADHPHREFLVPVVKDALDRLMLPSLEREVRRELTERAQEHAVMVFAKNLRSLLLQPPLRGKKVLAVDPGVRTGCKLAVLDETGKLLEDAVIYPHGQKRNAADSKRKLEQLVRKHQVSVVAIGNGTGCRETEQLVADLIADLENRRLNPTPVVPADAVPATSETTPATAPVVSAPLSSAPVASDIPPPLPDTITSAPMLPAEGMGTITSDVPTFPAMSGGDAPPPLPVGDTVTGGMTPGANTPGSGPPPVPAHPPAPPISLEGLPEAPTDLAYVIVIEAGASDYSASPVAREEFPTLDATTRGTISIGRRLQDPLAELVKIDPQHIGVGLYQHDVKPKHLKESLEAVIESSVNQVGVDLNTASVPLLRHVSGMNQLVAREVVNYRERNGAFTAREQLLQVSGLGEKKFTQAAGFLKIPDGSDPLDTTWIHPESYPAARQILSDLGFAPADLRDKAKLDELRGKLGSVNIPETAAKLGVGEPTVWDILDAVAKPGRDPRDDVPPPIFKKGVLKLEDIHPGMELKGTVLNVVPFGAFVDIGLKESGLVHISQIANRYIKSPYDVVAVGDVVTVWVIEVKSGEKKISLTMIPPGQERRPPERGGRFAGGPPPRGDRGDRPPPQQQQQQPADRPEFAPRGDRGDRGERPGFAPRGDRGDRPAFGPRGGGQQGGQGGRRFGGGPGGPGGRGPGGPPRQGAPAQGEGGPPAGLPPKVDLPPPRPKPQRPAKPLPNLTGDKKTGKAALNTFAELAAFFKTKDEPEKPKDEPKAEVKPEEPTPAPAAEEKPAGEPPSA